MRQDYTGYQKDNESGLEYAQARYYNTAHGRFTSVDPLTASATIRDPQSFNRYQLCSELAVQIHRPARTAAADISKLLRAMVPKQRQLC
ncbi:MAG: hypothetical protein IPK58_05300 [Acidobacteria bacterium]|nr:hypothetical protein [Acidobacteriota bacterium]